MISATRLALCMQNIKTSQLDTAAELEAFSGTKMISATRLAVCMQNIKTSQLDTAAESEAPSSTKMISVCFQSCFVPRGVFSLLPTKAYSVSLQERPFKIASVHLPCGFYCEADL